MLTVSAAFGGRHAPRELSRQVSGRRPPPRRGPRRSEPKGVALRRSVNEGQRDSENRVSFFTILSRSMKTSESVFALLQNLSLFDRIFFRVVCDISLSNRVRNLSLFQAMFLGGNGEGDMLCKSCVKSMNSPTHLVHHFSISCVASVPSRDWFNFWHHWCVIL